MAGAASPQESQCTQRALAHLAACPTTSSLFCRPQYCPGSVPYTLQDPAQIPSPGTPETTVLWGLRPKVATGAAAMLAPATPCALLLKLPVPMTWMLMVPAMAAAAPLRSPETVRGLMPCKHTAGC